jgi:hypothetical protein
MGQAAFTRALPSHLWHYIIRFCIPIDLFSLLLVNGHFCKSARFWLMDQPIKIYTGIHLQYHHRIFSFLPLNQDANIWNQRSFITTNRQLIEMVRRKYNWGLVSRERRFYE